ncbi:MAG: monovalent cation/H+ antiporter subunit D family protein [Firmicutes bacterium]|nr:monovalent cation/H+ antiporter subunit D family protein [Bacillota bacterium]
MNDTLWQPAFVQGLLFITILGVWSAGERRHKAALYVMIASLVTSMIILATLIQDVLGGKVYTAVYNILPPFGLSFQLDLLSLALSLLFLFVGAVLVLYLVTYPLQQGYRRFQTVFLLIITCATGVVMAGDLMSLFLFFEVMSVSFFILVIHDQAQASVAAAYKYLYMTVGGSVLYFMAVACIFSLTGAVSWSEAATLPAGPLTTLAFLGFVAAFGMKAGLFPLHIWMSDAYGQAPVPAMALSSLIMLKTGAYGLIRVVHQVFGIELMNQQGWGTLLLVLSIGSILYGSLCAFAEKDLPRRLAYSGMAQVGYITFGLAMVTPDALVGSLYHIVAHIMMKGTLILCAGAIITKTGKRKISELAGIGTQMPLTMALFSLAALTSVGLPPMNIFITKWYLSLGVLDAGQPFLIFVLLASSVLNAAYYLPISYTAFFGERNRDLHGALVGERLPATMVISMLILAVGCIAFSFMPQNIPLDWARTIAAGFFQ